MKNSLFTLIIFLLMFNNIMAQNKIEGKYNSDSKIFETNNKTYWIDLFENDKARISSKGYFGIMDSSGKIIVEPKYDKILEIESKVIRVIRDKKFILIDRNGNELFKKCMTIGKFNEGIAVFSEDGQNYGLLNERLEIILKPDKFSTLNDFNNGFSRYIKDGSYGIIDENGKHSVLFTDKDIVDNSLVNEWSITSESVSIIPVIRNNLQKYCFLDKNLKKISKLYFDYVQNFNNGYSVVKYNYKFGILSKNGKLLKTNYNSIHSVENGTFIVEIDNKVGVINNLGEIIIPIVYKNIEYLFANIYAVLDTNNIKRTLSISDIEFLPIQFYFIVKINPEIGAGFVREHLYGEIEDTNSQEHKVTISKSSLPKIMYTGHVYYFDKNGLIINKGFYVEFEDFFEVNSTVIGNTEIIPKVNSMFGGSLYDMDVNRSEATRLFRAPHNLVLINLGNRYKIVELTSFEGFFPLGLGKFIVEKKIAGGANNLFGVVDIDGNFVIQPKYQNLLKCNFNVLLAKTATGWGAVNYEDEIILPFKNDSLIPCSFGIICIKNNRYGLIDLTGREVIPYIYDKIEENTHYGLLLVTLNGKTYLVDKKGNKINTD